MECDVLVDGYNVIKNNLMFRALEIKNLGNARDLLLRQLKNRYRHAEERVTVVFDGDGKSEQVRHEDHIRVVFSRYGETADSVIVRLAAQARSEGRRVEMYSDDGEVRYCVTEQGGQVRTTEVLTKKLNAAPEDMTQRVMHRQAMRRMYGIDPMYKPDDDIEPSYTSRKKKKKSSRRRR